MEQSAPLMDPGGDLKPALSNDSGLLLHWLDLTWRMIDETLKQWIVPDLFKTYRHVYWGKTYAVSYQWTIWRIMCHDIQHGGQLAQMLGMQGLEVPELGDLGGHLTEPPVVEG
jgi:uncharacterized damage-inducible protein DinB